MGQGHSVHCYGLELSIVCAPPVLPAVISLMAGLLHGLAKQARRACHASLSPSFPCLFLSFLTFNRKSCAGLMHWWVS